MGKGNPEKAQTEGKKKAGSVSLRFTKDERIRNRKDFLRVYAESRRFVCPEFTGFYLRTGNDSVDDKPTRLGLSVSKRIGGSVLRNRLKRRIREVFRLHKYRLKRGYDIVINPKSGCAERGYAEIEKAMLGFFESACLINKD